MLSFEQFVKEMPLPGDWDKKTFALPQGKANRYTPKFRKALGKAIQYAHDHSDTFIDSGSSRAVFKIMYKNRPTALKIAINRAGFEQNAEEVKVLFGAATKNSPVIIPGIDYDTQNKPPLWIHQEFAESFDGNSDEFTDMVGKESYDIIDILEEIKLDYMGQLKLYVQDKKGMGQKIEPRTLKFLQDMLDFWKAMKYDSKVLKDLNGLRNWGIYKGRPVILDIGYTRKTSPLYSKTGAEWDRIMRTPTGISFDN